jgi:hypothetical protein
MVASRYITICRSHPDLQGHNWLARPLAASQLAALGSLASSVITVILQIGPYA